MKKVLIITGDNCDDSEILYPYYRMIEEGYEVDVASHCVTEIKAKYHFKINSNLAVADVSAKEYDGLILPGGSAPEKLRINDDVVRITKEFFESEKPIAAICHGPQILISAGVTKGVKMTCYPGIRDDLINAGAVYTDEKAVADKKIVTSRRPDDLPYFMHEYMKLLGEC